MKNIVLALAMVLLLALTSVAMPPQLGITTAKPANPGGTATVDNATYINANNILMFVTNHGNFARDLSGYFGYDAGTFFPYVADSLIESGELDKYCVYASGLWVGAIDSATGEKRVTIAEFSDEYVPGPMSGGTFMPDEASFKVYKLYSDSLASNPNDDYTNFPFHHGAPWDTTDAGDTIPAMIGDQMLWAVYNDADPDQHNNGSGETLPLGIEIRQTTFAFDRTDELGNMIFVRLQIFNKGANTLDSCFFSLWSDPDLGGSGDDLVGCDTTLSVGYVYNATNTDQYYGSTPPCVGYDFFQGPLLYTGNAEDTARMWGQLWEGYTNMPMYSFNKYINGTDPDDATQSYNYMLGLERGGAPYTYLGQPTRYAHTGDPTKGIGDIDGDATPASDRRFMLSTGPVTFRPGDSTEIVAAIIVGDGVDRLSSIGKMKYFDKYAQFVFEQDFEIPKAPATPIVDIAADDNKISLHWTDTSEVDEGDYPFEGYAIWQATSAAGPWTQVANLDITNSIEDIFDEVYDDLTGAIEIRLVKNGTNDGVAHNIVIDRDYITGGPLNNTTLYYYKVDAYSFNPDATVKKTLTSSAVVSIRPQSPIAGTEWAYNFADTIDVTHIGPSDGLLFPFVINSRIFDNHTYQITFSDTLALHTDTTWDPAYPPGDPDEADHWTITEYNVGWHLVDITGGGHDTLLAYQWDQSGTEVLELIDGIELVQSGPPAEGKSYSYAASDPLNVSPVALADHPTYAGNNRWFTAGDGSSGELLFGGVYMEPNFTGATTVSPGDMKTVEIRFRPMETYTDLNGDGEYSIGEPYTVDDPAETQSAFMYTAYGNSASYSGFYPVPFTAWDVSDPANERQLNVCFRDRDNNHQWDLHNQVNDPLLPNGGDQRFPYTFIMNSDYDATGTYYGDGTGGTIGFWDNNDAMWVLWLGDRGTGGMLAEQSNLTLVPNIVNTPADTFTFTVAEPIVRTSGNYNMDDINVVPNPFYLYSSYDPTAGNYQLYFQHLPGECTISIYNLGGDLVRTLYKNDSETSLTYWDLRTERGLTVASGIYIYVVDSPEFGTKIGKMAVFTETEVLDLY
ncbi:MAG: hypothetical protein ABIJ45_11520 [Candidatus Zixiibacteriota bacterium]